MLTTAQQLMMVHRNYTEDDSSTDTVQGTGQGLGQTWSNHSLANIHTLIIRPLLRMKEIKQTPQDALLECVGIIRDMDFDSENALSMLVALVQKIRPPTPDEHEFAEAQLWVLVDKLTSDEQALSQIKAMQYLVLQHSNLSEILIESGIPRRYSFFAELNTRIKHKFLPPLKNEGSLLYAIDSIFYLDSDYKWVNASDDAPWIKLFSLLEVKFDIDRESRIEKFAYPLQIISCSIAALSVEQDLIHRINQEQHQHFIRQNKLLTDLIAQSDLPDDNILEYQAVEHRLLESLHLCERVLIDIRLSHAEKGTSVQQSYLLAKILKLIDRMRLILDVAGGRDHTDIQRMVDNFKAIVENENTKNSIVKYLKFNLQSLAYRVSEHAHDTGEHYITTDTKGYNKMFRSAMKGGFIISFVAIIKNLLHFIQMAPFWQGIVYSVNYATGFVVIHATGATLATKQPAMTASTIAGVLDKNKKKGNRPDIKRLSILFSQVVRSQTASFVGNLCIAFPACLLISYLWSWVMGFNIADPVQAHVLLDSNNPLKSGALLYACYTGIFLYLSGIISGYFDNKVVHDNIEERMRAHPFLNRTFSRRRNRSIANYVGKNLGLIMGNICLGIFLGMANFIQYVFGFNFDIRHITIATGNFAVGLQGLAFDVSFSDFAWTLIGVILIGVFNFLVSFSLAFFTALLSRGIRFRHYKYFLVSLNRLFLRYPLDFIRPPKGIRKPEDF